MALGQILGGLTGAYFGNPLLGSQIGGGLQGALSSLFSGPQQQNPFQLAQQQLLQQMQQPIQAGNFAPIRAEAERRFRQETIPGIAERFTQGGGQRSSAFQQQLAGAGANLQSMLAAQEPEFQLQRAQAEQGRLGQLASMLQGQQQLQENALARQQRGALGREKLGLQRQLQRMRSAQMQREGQRQAFETGQRRRYAPVNLAGQPSLAEQHLPYLLQLLGQSAKAASYFS